MTSAAQPIRTVHPFSVLRTCTYLSCTWIRIKCAGSNFTHWTSWMCPNSLGPAFADSCVLPSICEHTYKAKQIVIVSLAQQSAVHCPCLQMREIKQAVKPG